MSKKDICIIAIEVIILIASIVTIITNLTKMFRYNNLLTITENNREYIENSLASYANGDYIKKEITEIAYQQGLGDWYCRIYYEDGTTASKLFGDNEMKELQEYIIQNGYDTSEESGRKMLNSFSAIFVIFVYEIVWSRKFKKEKIRE